MILHSSPVKEQWYTWSSVFSSAWNKALSTALYNWLRHRFSLTDEYSLTQIQHPLSLHNFIFFLQIIKLTGGVLFQTNSHASIFNCFSVLVSKANIKTPKKEEQEEKWQHANRACLYSPNKELHCRENMTSILVFVFEWVQLSENCAAVNV